MTKKENPMSNTNNDKQYYYIAFRWYGDSMESADWCRFMERHFKSWEINYRNRCSQDDDYGNVIEVLVDSSRSWDKIIEAIFEDREFHDKLIQLEFDRIKADSYYKAWCAMDDLGLEGIFGRVILGTIDNTTEDDSDENPVIWKITVYFVTHIRKTDHCRWLDHVVYYTNYSNLTNPKYAVDYWTDHGKIVDHIEIERVHGDCDDR